jgi:hypothetical protein
MPYGEIIMDENNEPVYGAGSYMVPDSEGAVPMRLSVTMEIADGGPDIGAVSDAAFQDILDRINESPYFQQPMVGGKQINNAHRVITKTPE